MSQPWHTCCFFHIQSIN